MYIRLNSNRYKTLLVFILSFSLYFNGFSQAYAAVGGWTLGNPVAVGASTVYEGTKQVIIDGKNYIKTGTAKITPAASQVSKVLARGVAGVALSVAVEQLLGAVDWVLDPANNQVVYYKEPSESKNCQTDSCKGEYIWYINPTLTNGNRVYYSAPSQSVAISLYRSYITRDGYYVQADITITGTRVSDDEVAYTHSSDLTDRNGGRVHVVGTLAFNRVLNPNADPEAEERERKTLPLETVAQQVISNAESDTDKKSAAQVATTAAAADIVAEAEGDSTKARPITQQLESSASTKPADEAAAEKDATATGTSKPQADPVTGEAAPPTDIALKFPMLCGLMPIVCEAAQVVVVTVPETIDAVKEWVTPEPETPEPETPPEIPDAAVNLSVTNYIQGSAYCPADRHVPLSMGGNTLDLVISYQPLCTVAQQFKPAVILMAFLAGAFIITNTGRRAETGD